MVPRFDMLVTSGWLVAAHVFLGSTWRNTPLRGLFRLSQEVPCEALLRCGHPTSIAEARDIIERYLEKARICKVAMNFTV